MNQQQSQGSGPSLSGSLGFALLTCRALAVSVEVFLHQAGSFGERYIGTQSAIALAIIFFFPVLWPQHDPAPLMYFDAAFLLRCAVVRFSTIKRRIHGGVQPHSYYAGVPSLMSAKSKTPETRFKLLVEPLLVGITGLLAQEWNRPLGTYLVVAAIGLFLTVGVSLRQDRVRALDMNDAMADQRRIAEQWRGMRRN